MARAARELRSNSPSQVGSGGIVTAGVLGKLPAAQKPGANENDWGIFAMTPLVLIGIGLGTGSIPGYIVEPVSTGATETFLRQPVAITPIWQRQLRNIKNKLQITTTDLARFLAVERPSVYQWFSKTEPRQRNMMRIGELSQLADHWAEKGLGSIRAHIGASYSDSSETLGELLSRTAFDSELISRAIDEIANRNLAISEPDRPSLSERLAARGFTPSDADTESRKRAVAIKSTSPGEG